MKNSSRLCIAVLACATAPAALTAEVDYPNKPVHLISAGAAGGNLDITARVTAQILTEALKQPFVVDNKPGANSMLATEYTVRSAPDGYTLLAVSNAHATNPTLVTKMPYDTLKDLAPISLITFQSNILVVNPEVPAKTIKELIVLAKAKPGELLYGSSGNGSTGNLAAELFNSLAGTKITQVPYKATAQLLTDVIAGRLQLSFSSLTSVLPHLKAGKLRALGSTGVGKRSPAAPDIPTIAEAGVAGYRSVNWIGMLGPAAMPRPIVERLSRTIVQRWSMPDVQSKFTDLGADPKSSTPDEMDQFVREEIKTWAKVIKAANIKVDLE